MKNLYILLLLLFVAIGFGQKTKPIAKMCYTDDVYQELLKKDPSLEDRMKKMNEEIRNFAVQYKKSLANKTAQTSFTIPVIIYIVHSGLTSGISNISDAQIQAQLSALNSYYSGSGFNFCLATKSGSQTLLQAANNLNTATSTTPGIVHVNDATIANHQTNSFQEQSLILKTSGFYELKSSNFLKIWVVESINGDTTSGIQGYSYYPNVSSILNGIVMNYRVFGNNSNVSCNCSLTANYQQGKILAHEVGHYLGLRHTFEGGCHDTSGSNSQYSGDFVSDTPPVKEANFGCPTGIDSCPADGIVDDISNFMDYTYDNCKNHFTQGQKDRMLFHLINYRSNLYDIDNLIFTGVCGSNNLVSSNFTSSLNQICSGNSITFRPITNSLISPTSSYAWDFGDGSNSTLENPTHAFFSGTNPFYTVTLTVTKNGITSSKSKNIFVSNCIPIVNNESTWYFTSNNVLKFNSGIPKASTFNINYLDPITTYPIYSSCAIQNDNNGNVQFFTNGRQIYDGSLPTSNVINQNVPLKVSNSYGGQSLILKSPTINNQYYIFHKKTIDNLITSPNSIDDGLRYSIVTLNNSLPTLSNNINIPIFPPLNSTYLISQLDGAIRGGTGVSAMEKHNGGYWIFTSILKMDKKRYLAIYSLDANGLQFVSEYLLPPYNQPYDLQTYNFNDLGRSLDRIEISPNGDKVFYNGVSHLNLLLDFDKFSGILSNPFILNDFGGFADAESDRYNGRTASSFSPNSKILYTTNENDLRQYNIDTPNISKNGNLISNYTIERSRSMQLGPDGKIYYLVFNGSILLNGGIEPKTVRVIHNPNALCSLTNPNACLNDINGIDLLSNTQGGELPNIIDAKNNTAYNVNQISAYKFGCNAYKFFPDVINNSTTPTFTWNFGDPLSGATNIITQNTPIHVFSGSGTYTITLRINGNPTPIATTQVTITTFTPSVIQGTSTICFSNGRATTFNSVSLFNGQTVVWSILSGSGTIVLNNQAEVQINWTQLGTIKAVITDSSGCIATVTKIITLDPNVIPTFSAVAPVCSGATIASLPTTSNNYITGVWSPAVNNLATTTYTFTPNTNYCATTVSLTITILPTTNPSCIAVNPCLPNITLTTPETNNVPFVYKKVNWIETNTNYQTFTNQNITMKAGDYVSLKPGTAIVAGSLFSAKIEICTSTSRIVGEKNVGEITENANLTIYPNPTSDLFTIEATSEVKTITILSMDGKVFYTNETVNTNAYELNASNFQSGMYLVIIETKDGTIYRKKLIKN